MINYLSKEEIIAINKKVVLISNDPHGVINEANLEYLIESIKYKYNSHEEELLLKAAFLLHFLANKAHAFIEGNKRTSITCLLDFLERNNLVFKEANQEKLADFVLQVASNKISMTKIMIWLKERVKNKEN